RSNHRTRRRQVDQIRRVRGIRSDPGLDDQSPELLHLLVGMPGQLPTLWRAQKDLHALSAERLSAGDARREATRGRDVRTDRHRDRAPPMLNCAEHPMAYFINDKCV